MARALVDVAPTLTHRIGPDEACAAATDFLLDHVGNQLAAGQPHLMVSAVQATWIVPVQLAYIHSGTLGAVGVVAVDEEWLALSSAFPGLDTPINMPYLRLNRRAPMD